MNRDYKAKYLTLDWDNISIDEARSRCQTICKNYSNVQKLVLSLSPTKGFHVRISLYGNSCIASLRKEWKDDGRRLVHDLLNRPDNIHDILWSRKTVSGIVWKAKKINTYEHRPEYGKNFETISYSCGYHDINGRIMCVRGF